MEYGNSLFWQCTAAEIECYTPAKDAQNRAYGCWAQFSGDGEWAQSNNHVQPRSIFYAQLTERLQKECAERARILPRNTSATSSPTVEVAMALAKEAYNPRLTLERWIGDNKFAPSVASTGVKSIDDIKEKKTISNKQRTQPEISIVNGRIQMDGVLLVGGSHTTPWWNGKLKTNFLKKASPAITRFVPGREGLGLTDRIDSVVSFMKQKNILVFDQNYGLWYDRRRDDHERIRRRDGDVWGPFYEQPFGRSGQGTAWEGLSKYDLKRPNAWYWSRLKEFAEKIDAPVCETLMGKGAFDNTRPRYTGMLGMHGTKASNFGVSQCDLLITVGARFSDRVTGNTQTFASNAKIIHIDVDAAEINKNIQVDLGIIGDAKCILNELNNKNIKYYILGGGSNVLLPDEDFDGAIIKLDKLNTFLIKNQFVFACAGLSLNEFVKKIIVGKYDPETNSRDIKIEWRYQF